MARFRLGRFDVPWQTNAGGVAEAVRVTLWIGMRTGAFSHLIEWDIAWDVMGWSLHGWPQDGCCVHQGALLIN